MNDFSLSSIKANLPVLGVREFKLAPEDVTDSHTTIIIGRNGSGKSTLLREIVAALRLSASGKIRRMPARSMLQSFSIHKNGEDNKVVISDLKQPSYNNDLWSAGSKLPSRLLALSFTPFDKFPPGTDSKFDDPIDDFYIYLGFKTESGRASPRSRLLKNIDRLAFRGTEVAADQRACKTLAAIGYDPKIKINYSLSGVARMQLKDYRSRSDQEMLGKMYTSKSREGGIFIDKFITYGLERFFPKLNREENIEFSIDFSTGSSGKNMPLETYALRDLLESRLLTVGSIQIFKVDEPDPIDLLELSSGELNILSGFFGLAAHLIDGSLILVDEPENSLHPAWQIKYIKMLEAVLESHRGCHCIIATHSPLILSGAAANNSTIVRLDQDPVSVDPTDFALQSPDQTLVTAFDVITNHNNYIKQIVLEGLTLIQTGEADSDRANDIANLLSHIIANTPVEDPIREVMAAIIARVGN